MSAVLIKKRRPVRNTYTMGRQPSMIARQGRSDAPLPARTVDMSSAALRRAALWLGGLAVVALLFFGLSTGLMRLYHYCLTSERFAVADITVEGTRQLSTEDILQQSGLYKGINAFAVHIPEVEQKLLQNPWVESVFIRRELPDRFLIQIQERVPQFWVLRDGVLQYLDNHGILIAPVESSNFMSLPTLDIGPGGEEALPYLADFISYLANTDMPFELSQISWLRVSAGKGFELYWESKQLSLSIGMEQWKDNLRRLSLVVEDMEKRGEIAHTREIRAADGQVWLQKA